MIISYEKGDWVQLALEAIDNEAPLWFGHGCNCRKTMGAGVAEQVRKRIPELYEADQMTNTNWLGNWSFWMPRGRDHSMMLFNLYTQKDLGADARLKSIFDVFTRLNDLYLTLKLAMNKGFPYSIPTEIVIPMIGSGIGGLKWEDVAKAIDEATPDLPVRVIEWERS